MIAVIWNGRQATSLLSISPRDLEACSCTRIVWFLEDWYKTIVQLGGMKMKRYRKCQFGMADVNKRRRVVEDIMFNENVFTTTETTLYTATNHSI